ncbi:hypothetical protein P171DRAFT_484337 [Karstenula rhodostoma CBS 690.94]|uniref:Uncharacterized protein n=1 Tax=Karstenula rhodostoma CBS 690.94 TaxID=1392251 RepID=A0A9P4UD01_9PLEO|nr:hypothetical protein P171DRAFT_484337 [Karstenula rhodostoma CBS 690.94]
MLRADKSKILPTKQQPSISMSRQGPGWARATDDRDVESEATADGAGDPLLVTPDECTEDTGKPPGTYGSMSQSVEGLGSAPEIISYTSKGPPVNSNPFFKPLTHDEPQRSIKTHIELDVTLNLHPQFSDLLLVPLLAHKYSNCIRMKKHRDHIRGNVRINITLRERRRVEWLANGED